MSLPSRDLNPSPWLYIPQTLILDSGVTIVAEALLFLMKLHFGPHATAPVLNHTHTYNCKR